MIGFGNEIADKLAREDTIHQFLGPEPAVGISRRSIRNIKRWMDNQDMAMWRGLISNQRHARKLISGYIPTANTRLLSFKRTQSRVVTGLLVGSNTLRRSLHLMRLTSSPLYRRCGAGEETSAHVRCECKTLASLGRAYLGSFFLDPEDVSLG
jgi:hypothetical protein